MDVRRARRDGLAGGRIPDALGSPEHEVIGAVALLEEQPVQIGRAGGDGQVQRLRAERGPAIREDRGQVRDPAVGGLLRVVVAEQAEVGLLVVHGRVRPEVDQLVREGAGDPAPEVLEVHPREVGRRGRLGRGPVPAGRGKRVVIAALGRPDRPIAGLARRGREL